MKFNQHVSYLEDEDFDSNGRILLDLEKPLIVMLQGEFCGFCREMKPSYQDAAEKSKNIAYFSTIQMDGDESEKKLAKRFGDIVGMEIPGVPSVYAILPNGSAKEYSGDRSTGSLCEFVKSL